MESNTGKSFWPPHSRVSSASTFQVQDAQPYWYTYAMFMVFGAGSGWFIVNALFLQLVIYEERFGLKTANRLSLGYELGAICVPCFLVALKMLRRLGYSIGYPKLIMIKAGIDVLVLIVMSHGGMSSLESIILFGFVSGAGAWLTGVIHVAHITLHYQNVFTAAYFAGDAALGVLLAILAVIENPEAGPDSRTFAPTTFYMCLIPVILFSQLAFNRIESQGIGKLSIAQRGPPASNAAGIELASTGQSNVAPAETFQNSSYNNMVFRSLPSGATSRPLLTISLLALGFFLSFSCFGIGDSLAPYACKNNSRLDEGRDCYFKVNVSSFFGLLLGAHLASIPTRPKTSMLVLPSVGYTVCFILMCLAGLVGGPWALEGHSNTAAYIMFLSFMMYTLQPCVSYLRQRLVQVLYDPSQWEDMNQLFFIQAVIANVTGACFGALILPRAPSSHS